MKVVIFAGGRGTRISEESSLRPKPMIEIGGKPILWHIMKIYAAFGHTEFIICLGYKAHVVKEYFANYFLHNADLTVDLKDNSIEWHRKSAEPFKISLIDTGLDTMTAGRLKRVLPYVGNEPFMLTYGDGVCDVDLNEVVKFHKASGKICTMTAIQATSRFGVLKMEDDGTIDSFEEKPEDSGTWINGGFFVIEPEIAKYLHDDADDIMWERQPMNDLARDRQIAAYKHHGFWKCMDTLRDKEELEQMWQKRRDMEKVVSADYLRKAYAGKKVFLTGHTGFKGTWMLQILHWLGANVKGYSLAPEKANDLYHQVQGDKLCYSSVIADICDKQKLQTEIARFEPDFVFHLAAQPLVRRGYDMPSYTFMVNAQGTAHVLDAMRALTNPAAGIMITTDKVYDNPERGLPFAEDDKLGGYDPYSASKASAEIVIDSYRRSFFNPAKHDKHLKSISAARAGNVIGGGDYSDDRIVVDIVKAVSFGETVGLRNPASVRPWQHVLEPLSAYLQLGAKMAEDPIKYSTAYNFGPNPEDMLTVEELTKVFIESYGQGAYETMVNADAPHEAKLLLLNSDKAMQELGWQSVMDARTAIRWTAEWYANKQTPAHEKCMGQIQEYFG